MALELEKKGKIHLIKQKDYFKTKEDIMRIIDNCDDVADLVTNRLKEKVDTTLTINKLVDGVLKEPHRYITSVISIWEYENEITRLDCGAVELKYLFKGNYLWPKKKYID